MSHRSSGISMMSDQLSKDVEKIKAALSQTALDVKDKAGEFVSKSIESAKEKSEDLEKSLASYVVKNPIKAVGYSMLAGMFCAWLLRK